MEPSMINYFLKNDGIIQMYLNSIMYVDFTNNLEDDFDMLCKYLRRNNLYNFEEKKIYSGVSNSFSNFVQTITGMSFKSVSPRTINKLHKNFNNSKLITSKYKIKKLFKNKKVKTIINI